MTWGASLLEVNVPDRDGKIANVNCVFEKLEPYLNKHPYFGSSVGRFANRIANAKFSIEGNEYSLTVNHKQHQLHGGKQNFAFQNWSGEVTGDSSVKFSLKSPDGHEGYPGNVDVTAEYAWNDQNELLITYTATSDALTHVNLTNHSYWNLGGIGSGSMLNHILMLHADQVLDVDGDLIPTGRMNSVEGTPFDFRTPTAIGDRNGELPATKGYDHCLIVRGEAGELRSCAHVVDPDSGRVMEVETTQPGVQVYAAGNLPGGEKSAGNGPHDAFCLETQHYPDTPNHPSFPSTLVGPGDVLKEVTLHRFGVQSTP
jgi:aldose 1-epimerase